MDLGFSVGIISGEYFIRYILGFVDSHGVYGFYWTYALRDYGGYQRQEASFQNILEILHHWLGFLHFYQHTFPGKFWIFHRMYKLFRQFGHPICPSFLADMY